MTRKEFTLFCTILYSLLKSKLAMEQALRIISKTKHTPKKIQFFAMYVLEELHEGASFSSLLNVNPYIEIPQHYLALFSNEEKTGSILQTLSFICTKEKRRNESIETAIKSALYPFIIILLSCIGSVLIFMFRSSFGQGIDEHQFYMGFGISLGFLVLCIVVYIYFAVKIFRDNDYFLFIFTFHFLLEAGFDTFTAFECSAFQFDVGTKTFKSLTLSISRLKKGESFYAAISTISFFPQYFLLTSEYIQQSGEIKGSVKNALEIETKSIEQKRKSFLALSEPLMIICAGVYLLILVQCTVIPVLTNFGGYL